MLLTPEQLAEFLQLKKSTIYYLTKQKKIPHLKIGRAVRFDAAEIEAWVKSSHERVEATTDTLLRRMAR